MFSGFKNSIFNKNEIQIQEELFFEEINNKIKEVSEKNGTIYFFGNGASAAFSNHMALDFSKNGKIKSRSLSDSSLLTALSNDYSYEDAMLEFLKIENPSKDDFIITISSSGNSKNIVNVLKYAKNEGIGTLALSGLNFKNKSILLSKYSIFVPMKTYGMVECMHQIYLHLILDHFMGIEEWNKLESQNMDSSNFKL
jgi:D-sedoheptulose 7-phosphate isomerase